MGLFCLRSRRRDGGAPRNCHLLVRFGLARWRSVAQRILVTGGDGLLAFALRGLASADFEMTFLSRGDFDLTSADLMRRQLEAVRPEVVAGAAAHVARAVDRVRSASPVHASPAEQ